jgi:HEAT repeats
VVAYLNRCARAEQTGQQWESLALHEAIPHQGIGVTAEVLRIWLGPDPILRSVAEPFLPLLAAGPLPALLPLLKAGDAHVRSLAFLLHSDDVGVRQPDATRHDSRQGQESMTELVQGMELAATAIRAVLALPLISPQCMLSLRRMVLDRQCTLPIRIHAAAQLGRLHCREAAPALALLTGDASEPHALRGYVCGVLGDLGNPVVVPALLTMLQNADGRLAEEIYRALARLADDAAVIPALEQAARHERDPYARIKAYMAAQVIRQRIGLPEAVDYPEGPAGPEVAHVGRFHVLRDPTLVEGARLHFLAVEPADGDVERMHYPMRDCGRDPIGRDAVIARAQQIAVEQAAGLTHMLAFMDEKLIFVGYDGIEKEDKPISYYARARWAQTVEQVARWLRDLEDALRDVGGQ